jgi:hypothetical protein
MRIGEVDKHGNILRRQRSFVELWEQSKNRGFVVCIWPTPENTLWSYRRHRHDADELFDDVCLMFSNLPPE